MAGCCSEDILWSTLHMPNPTIQPVWRRPKVDPRGSLQEQKTHSLIKREKLDTGQQYNRGPTRTVWPRGHTRTI